MKQPFMTFVTRCCRRPVMLTENIQSVKAQTCRDLEQIFIVDRERKSIQVADRALDKFKNRVDGQYVYILDDDGFLTDPDFVTSVHEVVEVNAPDVIMVKSKRPPGKPSYQSIVPTKAVWGGKPRHGSTNPFCYVIRAELWKRHIYMFGVKPWGGDWWFLEDVLKTKPSVYWLDRIVADCRQLGRGKIFEQVKPGWFERVAKAQGLTNLGQDDWRLRLWMRD